MTKSLRLRERARAQPRAWALRDVPGPLPEAANDAQANPEGSASALLQVCAVIGTALAVVLLGKLLGELMRAAYVWG